MTPIILATLQYTVLVVVMSTWLMRSQPEVPFTWHGPASSLVMGIVLLLYYRVQAKQGKLPNQVLWSSMASCGVTFILVLLAISFPERECCCAEGVTPERVPKGTCSKGTP